MKLTFYLVTSHYELEHPSNEPFLTNIYQGIYQAEEQLFGSIQTNNWDEIRAYHSEREEVDRLKIGKWPALIIHDANEKVALIKLERHHFTIENVKNACILAWSLKVDKKNRKNYLLPDGSSLSIKQL